MKTWFKENSLYLLSFFILSLIVVYYCSIYYTNFDNSRKYFWNTPKYEEYYNLCINGSEPANSYESCSKIIINYENQYDLFYHFSYSVWEGNTFLPFFSCLFVMIPAIFNFIRKTKKGNLKNQLVRQSYSSFLKKEYKKSLKASLILPGIMLLFLLIAGIYTSFKVGNSSIYQYYHVAIFEPILENPFLFVIFLLLTFFVQSILFINIAYIVSYYCKNLILTILGCAIVFFLLAIGLEGLWGILSLIFNRDMSLVWLTAIWEYDGIDNIVAPLVVNIIYVLISFGIMYMTYNSKENMVVNCEKF